MKDYTYLKDEINMILPNRIPINGFCCNQTIWNRFSSPSNHYNYNFNRFYYKKPPPKYKYFRETRKRIRRFYARNQARIMMTGTMCIGMSIFHPIIREYYYALTMPEKEHAIYRERRQKLVMLRAIYGYGFWNPFEGRVFNAGRMPPFGGMDTGEERMNPSEGEEIVGEFYPSGSGKSTIDKLNNKPTDEKADK